MNGIQIVAQRPGVTSQSPVSGVVPPRYVDAAKLTEDIQRLSKGLHSRTPYTPKLMSDVASLACRLADAFVTAKPDAQKSMGKAMFELHAKLLNMVEMPIEHWLQLEHAPKVGHDELFALAA